MGRSDTSRILCFVSHNDAMENMLTEEEYQTGIAEVRTLLFSGATPDELIQTMKRLGFSPIECIKGMMELTDSTLPEATRAVHFSAAWPELRA